MRINIRKSKPYSWAKFSRFRDENKVMEEKLRPVKTSEKAAGNNGASSSTKPKLGGGGSRSQVPSLEDRRNKPEKTRL
jgi:hypothetical protein